MRNSAHKVFCGVPSVSTTTPPATGVAVALADRRQVHPHLWPRFETLQDDGKPDHSPTHALSTRPSCSSPFPAPQLDTNQPVDRQSRATNRRASLPEPQIVGPSCHMITIPEPQIVGPAGTRPQFQSHKSL